MRKLSIVLLSAVYLFLFGAAAIMLGGCDFIRAVGGTIKDCAPAAVAATVEKAAVIVANDAVAYAQNGKAPTGSEWASHGIALAGAFGWNVIEGVKQHLAEQKAACAVPKPAETECHEHPQIAIEYAREIKPQKVAPMDASNPDASVQ